MSIMMKLTYNESLFLKVSKHELPIDGVRLGMNFVLRSDKLSHMQNKAYTFIYLQTSYTVITTKRWRKFRFILCTEKRQTF